jgi:Polysaccharide deacetylase
MGAAAEVVVLRLMSQINDPLSGKFFSGLLSFERLVSDAVRQFGDHLLGNHSCLLVLLSVLPLLVTGCKKGESNLTQTTLSPTASASPTSVAQATPTPPPDTNRTAKFIVFLYHRFEERPAELVTTPDDFRAQMKALKDNGISVISMQDLLAWRKGEKAIPSKSAVITIDDEWNSQYYVAWPILKEFGYPFTLFIYTPWVNTGGKAMLPCLL